MRKMLLLLSVCLLISATLHADTVQYTLTVVSDKSVGSVGVEDKTNNTFKSCNGTTPCTFTFAAGTEIKLNAFSSNPGTIQFQIWKPISGSALACNIAGPGCTFTLTQNSSATARFEEVLQLSVQIGTGTGRIRVLIKNNILVTDCTAKAPQLCGAGQFKGSSITIQNFPDSGQKFGGYGHGSGSATACTTDPCTFVLNENSRVVTNFVPAN